MSLLYAIERGDSTKISDLLDRGADPNETDEYGWSVLFEASSQPFPRIVSLLILNGARVDQCTSIGETALMIASKRGRENNVKSLLHNGANVDFETKDGSTALMVACREGKSDIVSLLLEYGANVNHKSVLGDTALMCAVSAENCFFERRQIINELLKAGADIGIKDDEGRNCLHYAAAYSYPELVGELLKNKKPLDTVFSSCEGSLIAVVVLTAFDVYVCDARDFGLEYIIEWIHPIKPLVYDWVIGKPISGIKRFQSVFFPCEPSPDILLDIFKCLTRSTRRKN